MFYGNCTFAEANDVLFVLERQKVEVMPETFGLSLVKFGKFRVIGIVFHFYMIASALRTKLVVSKPFGEIIYYRTAFFAYQIVFHILII